MSLIFSEKFNYFRYYNSTTNTVPQIITTYPHSQFFLPELWIHHGCWVAGGSDLTRSYRTVSRQRDVTDVTLHIGVRVVAVFGALWKLLVVDLKFPVLHHLGVDHLAAVLYSCGW